jgi:nucleotide-binding universal stress UspA family protein
MPLWSDRDGARGDLRQPAVADSSTFERILVGNDGSEAALMALRLASRLRGAAGELVALTVAELHLAAHAGLDAPEWDRRLRGEAEDARRAAERELPAGAQVKSRMIIGHVADELLKAAQELDADLVAIGSHGRSRAAGMLLGSAATRVIHDAPCSVLVARGDVDTNQFPQRMLVGIDTSAASAEAEVMAELLAEASGADLRRLTATGGKPLPDDAALTAELDARSPVEALVDAGRGCDLLVVGSRGLHGPAALGSVAERVAHEAPCPVLIVRR